MKVNKYPVPDLLLNGISHELAADTAILTKRISGLINEFNAEHNRDPTIALFVSMRVMNMASAKAARALQAIHGDYEAENEIDGMEAGISLYQRFIEILQSGINAKRN
jgi:hypothetical protein